MKKKARLVAWITVATFLVSIASYAAWSTYSFVGQVAAPGAGGRGTAAAGEGGQVLKKEEQAELVRFLGGFLEKRLARDLEGARTFLSEKAREELREPGELIGVSNPHYSSYTIMIMNREGPERFSALVRITESTTGEGEIGYFDEELGLVYRDGKYQVDSLRKSPFVNLKERG